MARPLSIAIVGAGMGGLATAAALRRVGIDVTVYEQATQFARIGAGIQIGCNAMKVLRGLGLEARLRGQSFYPRSWNNRDWRTGEVKFDMIFGESAEQKFGAPYLLAHRGDLHAALASAVPDECVRLNHKLVGLDETGDGVRLTFANGTSVTADAVVGADGVHSVVRDILFGVSPVNFTGRIAYRTTYPAALLGGEKIDDCTKWWGEDRHIVIYYVKPDRSEIYLVTSQPEPDFRIESWSAKGDVKRIAQGVRRFRPPGRTGAGGVPRRAQMGDRRSQFAGALGRRQRDAARRCLPSDDALHGAGRGDGDRGCRRAVALPRRRRPRRRRECIPPLRGDAQGAHDAHPADFARQYLAQRQDRCRLGLWLRRLDGAVGGVVSLHCRPRESGDP